MLPPEWKREIEEALQKERERSDENRKRAEEKQEAAIAAPLRRLVDHYEADQEKRRTNEWVKRIIDAATIGGLFLTAYFAFAQLKVFEGQLHEMEKTYKPLKEQAAAATRAAKASEDSAKAVSDNFRIDQRPYLWVTDNMALPFRFQTGQIVWNVEYTNYGKTPAVGGLVTRRIKIGDADFVPDANPILSQTGVPSAPLAPNKTNYFSVLSPTRFTEAEFQTIMKTGGHIVISVKFEYSDLFGGGHETNLCLTYFDTEAIGFVRIASAGCTNDIK
jgi:hypothetical protein